MRQFTRNEERITAVASTFRRYGGEALEILESRDPQMKCAESLLLNCGVEDAAELMGMNALLSYMIPVRGEMFWASFMNHSLKACGELSNAEIVESFTKRMNRFGLTAKLRRIKRFEACASINPPPYLDLRSYWDYLKKCFHAEGVEKTLAFSVKMVYYVLKAAGLNPEIPAEIPVPADRRAALITLTSGLVLPAPKSFPELRELGKEVFRKPSLIREVWGMVAKRSSIPPLRLDAAIWLAGRFVEEWSISKAVMKLREALGLGRNYGCVEAVVKELLHALPP